MLGLTRRRQVDWFLGKVQIATAVAVVTFGAALKADPTQFANVPSLQTLLNWMQDWAWLVVVIGPFLVAGVQWGRRRFGSPWAWEAIQKLLDEFRNEVFGHLTDDPLDHHRVTLFRYRKLAMGVSNPFSWRHWLVAVARSDHLTKARIRRFRAPDDGELCEGVVGRAWRCKGWVLVPGRGPSLPEPKRAGPPAEVSEYAKETGVDTAWVQRQVYRGRPLAASYGALVVRLKGQPWGVLVLDSRKAATIDPAKLEKFKAFGNLLTPLLERV